jgi:hypothetical protein
MLYVVPLHQKSKIRNYGTYLPQEHPHTPRSTALHRGTDANDTLYARHGEGRGEKRGGKANEEFK